MDQLFVSSHLERRTFLQMFAVLYASPQDNKSKDKEAKPIVYTPGGDVKPPKVIHYVEPSFSASSKEAFVDGVVTLKTTVTPEGVATDIEIVHGLSTGEDHNAVEAVKQWRFQPGTKAGEPVHVRIGIEIAFHLM